MPEKEDESPKPSALKDLDQRLRQARGTEEQFDSSEQRGNALGLAFRLVTELVAGVVVGGVIGWSLDFWFGTTPWFLLIFFALGSLAGILNVVRTAHVMNAKQALDDDVVGRAEKEDTQDT